MPRAKSEQGISRQIYILLSELCLSQVRLSNPYPHVPNLMQMSFRGYKFNICKSGLTVFSPTPAPPQPASPLFQGIALEPRCRLKWKPLSLILFHRHPSGLISVIKFCLFFLHLLLIPSSCFSFPPPQLPLYPGPEIGFLTGLPSSSLSSSSQSTSTTLRKQICSHPSTG